MVYGIFRYIYLIHHHEGGGSPEELVLKDRPLALDIVLYGLTVLALLCDLSLLTVRSQDCQKVRIILTS